jgi:hypothetical protein
MGALFLPADYPRIKVMDSFEELVRTPFSNGINALCWRRELAGDFGEVLRHLSIQQGITTLDEAALSALSLSRSGEAAVAAMLKDLSSLRNSGLDPVLDCVNGYLRDDCDGPVPTDVYSFHADSSPIETDTYLCTYHGASSEGLRNDQALRKVDIPEIRAALLDSFGGDDDEAFREHLSECCYDLHYAPLEAARPFSFGVGNLWRIAVKYPKSPVPPCIHRAPQTQPGDSARLLLIS